MPSNGNSGNFSESVQLRKGCEGPLMSVENAASTVTDGTFKPVLLAADGVAIVLPLWKGNGARLSG